MSKAKIERSFRTIKDNFINCKDWTKYTSLEELNNEYIEYISQEYNSLFVCCKKNENIITSEIVMYAENDINLI